jgi:hypothetical protein
LKDFGHAWPLQSRSNSAISLEGPDEISNFVNLLRVPIGSSPDAGGLKKVWQNRNPEEMILWKSKNCRFAC